MTKQDLIKAIIEGAKEYLDEGYGMDKCIAQFCEELADEAYDEYFIQSALDAGIPMKRKTT